LRYMVTNAQRSDWGQSPEVTSLPEVPENPTYSLRVGWLLSEPVHRTRKRLQTRSPAIGRSVAGASTSHQSPALRLEHSRCRNCPVRLCYTLPSARKVEAFHLHDLTQPEGAGPHLPEGASLYRSLRQNGCPAISLDIALFDFLAVAANRPVPTAVGASVTFVQPISINTKRSQEIGVGLILRWPCCSALVVSEWTITGEYIAFLT